MGDHDDESRALFREAARGARPLKQDRAKLLTPKPKPVAHRRKLDDEEVVASLLSDDYDPSDVETGEELVFCRTGIQNRVFRKFRRGEYAIEAELDLHGRTVPEARELVAAFLRDCRDYRKRCVRIIHGKGRGSPGTLPVLKTKVNQWLRQKDEVLAFCTARPADGGGGAVYVLLKRG